jgi:hypothetical protein
VAVRGLADEEADVIRLDLETRRRLQVSIDEAYDFELAGARFWHALQWAARSSDPAARVATWIAIWSLSIGALISVAGILIAVLWH